jgi:hypothetical protein
MDGGGITVYTEVSSVCEDLISFTLHYVFDDGGELVGSADMRFRSEQAVHEAVQAAGFSIDQTAVTGKAVGSTDGELLVLA